MKFIKQSTQTDWSWPLENGLMWMAKATLLESSNEAFLLE